MNCKDLMKKKKKKKKIEVQRRRRSNVSELMRETSWSERLIGSQEEGKLNESIKT
jgi:hypothetical protein